ncbi:lipopolysaccharide biosynthesis protein [Pseudomonas mandelii]|uniref:lipopolysaccharide biosynthesis protein n=1 Tax=Pseudomonas mandelii TaxID=75612 RepID=UPI00224B95FB|nr:lipopolysaccharide biosynthesis protein [Pseudomonas mandelii]MCX2897883.1 lipopolysaccharide biosynthesis protein [Pseudomonas mandelii]
MDVAQKATELVKSPVQVHDLDECRNINNGAVFIIASGASAKDFPLKKYADVPMITMNGAISMFIGTGIKPYFFMCSDDAFYREQPRLFAEAMRLSQRVAVPRSHAYCQALNPKGELYLLTRAPRLSWLGLLGRRDRELIRSRKLGAGRNRSLGFSQNLKRGFFDARTVAYVALQIAYHLGFSKVFLVGVDLNQSVKRFYETPGTFVSPCTLDEHLHTRILPSFKIMSKYVMNQNFQVYNLSDTSRIPAELVPRVTFEDVDRMIGA